MNIEEFLVSKGYEYTNTKGFKLLARLLKEFLIQNNRYQSIQTYINDIVKVDGGNYSQYQRTLRHYVRVRSKKESLKQEILDLYDCALFEVGNLHK
jgi:hypothetical protein